MRTVSHSWYSVYLNLQSMPPKGFSPPYKEPVVGQAGLSWVKSGDNFIFLTSLSFKPAQLALPSQTLDHTSGDPVSFLISHVVNKQSHSPMPRSAKESQNRSDVPKKQVACKYLQCDTICIKFKDTQTVLQTAYLPVSGRYQL